MPLVLYNSLTKNEEEFAPLREGEVRMYTCGPTVYGRPHIGNYSSFLLADLLRRWLEAGHNMKITHVKNITDVGHLTNDDAADAGGDDKIEKQSRKENIDPLEIARKYADQYIEDEKTLNFIEPEHRPRATETIPEMIEMTKTLLERGHAYETEDGIYFDALSFEDYGKLSGNTLEHLTAGARIEVDQKKKHPADFALWKKCVGENANHILRWDSPWGEGFPGWHIECSCMSEKFLGSPFDMHTGGEDLIFPHHECEIAQSVCSGDGKPHVRYWLHKRFIDIGDTKMSKSLGNVLTLPDIDAMGYDPLDLRYYLLSVHYRTNLKFSEKGLDDAKKARRKIVDWMHEIRTYEKEIKEIKEIKDWEKKFKEAMNSDLNTPEALGIVFDCMSDSRNKGYIGSCEEFAALIRETFGCFELSSEERASLPAEVQRLIDERQKARDEKDFAASDALRDQISELGYEVKDTAGGQEIRKA